MPQISGIYVIVNTMTNACYVGSAVDFAARKRLHLHHLRNDKHHSPYLQRSFNKYGEDAFVFSVIEHLLPNRDVLFERETYWIQTLEPEYNASQVSATRLGIKSSPETIEKVRAYNLLPEVRKRKSDLMKGRIVPPEVREKIKQTLTGRKVSDEVKQNLLKHSLARTTEERRLDQLGKKRSEETRRKLSGSAKNRLPQSRDSIERGAAKRRGSKQSEESKQKRSESMKIAWQEREVSEEERQQASERSKSWWEGLSEEERKVLSEQSSKSHKGVKRSEASRKKQSETLKARGYKHSEESRKLQSERRKEAWERNGVTDEDRERLRDQAKTAWERKSPEEQEATRQHLRTIRPQLTEEDRRKRSEAMKAIWAARKAAKSQEIDQPKLFE